MKMIAARRRRVPVAWRDAAKEFASSTKAPAKGGPSRAAVPWIAVMKPKAEGRRGRPSIL